MVGNVSQNCICADKSNRLKFFCFVLVTECKHLLMVLRIIIHITTKWFYKNTNVTCRSNCNNHFCQLHLQIAIDLNRIRGAANKMGKHKKCAFSETLTYSLKIQIYPPLENLLNWFYIVDMISHRKHSFASLNNWKLKPKKKNFCVK